MANTLSSGLKCDDIWKAGNRSYGEGLQPQKPSHNPFIDGRKPAEVKHLRGMRSPKWGSRSRPSLRMRSAKTLGLRSQRRAGFHCQMIRLIKSQQISRKNVTMIVTDDMFGIRC